LETVLVEVSESSIEFEVLLHDFEAVVEGDVEGSPHLLGHIPE
jgi:hypothetical protein